MKFSVPNQPSGKQPASAGFSRGEKLRLAFMAVGLVLVVGGFFYANMKAVSYRESDDEKRDEMLPAQEEDDAPVVTTAMPPMDTEALGALVAEADNAQRVVLEPEAVLLAEQWTRRLTERHYQELGIADVDAAVLEEIAATSAASRGAAFRLRGGIDALERRSFGGEDGFDAWLVRLVLDDLSRCFVVARDLPAGHAAVGAYVRFDGLFLKVFRDDAEGDWFDAPLFVSSTSQVSYPELGDVSELGDMLADVRDHGPGYVAGVPFTEHWLLMKHAQTVGAEGIDWASAPLLDRQLIGELALNGDSLRGTPVRVPISRIMDARVKRAGENPARLVEYTEGWIGNTTWSNVIKFTSPIPYRELDRKDLATAYGFFLMNHAYQQQDGVMRTAPLFVMAGVEPFVPPQDTTIQAILIGVVAATALLVVLFCVLLARDKRRSQRLQEDLIRRRRARRAKAAQA